MANNGLRTQYPYAGEALSPRPMYDYPSPTSNYPSGIGGAASPSFYPMAYQISPRFGASAFIPPADVFGDGRNETIRENGGYTPREFRKRNSDVVGADPVAMHLLVETAMGDSQYFDILTVEEVDALKQEQKVLDAKLGTVRRKLESETKIRDATRSLSRLASKKSPGHRRGLSSKGSITTKEYDAKSVEALDASNKKVEDLIREVLEIESRMRMIDMQLLMHTAAVLQLTHKGPKKDNVGMGQSEDGYRRPDSPVSLNTYEVGKGLKALRGENGFDERSFYRSPENLDNLMDVLHNGTHLHAENTQQQTQAFNAMAKRLEEMNEKLRTMIVKANPAQEEEYSLPPLALEGTLDASTIDRQLDFLDQGLKSIGAEQANLRGKSRHSMSEMEGRLEGINNQLYAVLSRANAEGSDKILPPPPITGDGSKEQLNYMEDSFYSLEQIQYSLNGEIEELRSKGSGSEDVEKYENALQGLWQTILAGEEEARERKRERRRALADDPDADEQLSPDEEGSMNEPFSLLAFTSKVQLLSKRALSLKDKQSVLMRQIKQQRELNSKSDAQKEAEFERLNEEVLSARSEKKSMEGELERAMGQLRQFDDQKIQMESQSREVQQRSADYEAQIRNAQARADALEDELNKARDDARIEGAAIQAELTASSQKINEITVALQQATAAKEDAEAKSLEATKSLESREAEFQDLEGEVVRLTTELTFAKAELDGAYGSRAQRAADSAANPAIKKELDDLRDEVERLNGLQATASTSEANLKSELSGMAAEYEALTRDAIQNEKDRDLLESQIDKLRDEKEALERDLSDEKVKWLGVRSPGMPAAGQPGAPGQLDMGATSIRMLREDFRKMMRDRTQEGLKALRVSCLQFCAP